MSSRLRSSALDNEDENRSTRHQKSTQRSVAILGISRVLALSIAVLTPTASNAYTAAGDRNFTAQLILPQIGPTDAIWVTVSTQPMEAFQPKDPTRETGFKGNYSKLITKQLGIQLQDGLIDRNRLRASSVTGAHNFR